MIFHSLDLYSLYFLSYLLFQALPPGSVTLLSTYEALPDVFEALPAASEALPAASEALPAASEALNTASDGLPAASEILSAASDAAFFGNGHHLLRGRYLITIKLRRGSILMKLL